MDYCKFLIPRNRKEETDLCFHDLYLNLTNAPLHTKFKIRSPFTTTTLWDLKVSTVSIPTADTVWLFRGDVLPAHSLDNSGHTKNWKNKSQSKKTIFIFTYNGLFIINLLWSLIKKHSLLWTFLYKSEHWQNIYVFYNHIESWGRTQRN